MKAVLIYALNAENSAHPAVTNFAHHAIFAATVQEIFGARIAINAANARKYARIAV